MTHNLESLKKAIYLESFKEIRKELEGFEKELQHHSAELSLILDQPYSWLNRKLLIRVVNWHSKFEKEILG